MFIPRGAYWQYEAMATAWTWKTIELNSPQIPAGGGTTVGNVSLPEGDSIQRVIVRGGVYNSTYGSGVPDASDLPQYYGIDLELYVGPNSGAMRLVEYRQAIVEVQLNYWADSSGGGSWEYLWGTPAGALDIDVRARAKSSDGTGGISAQLTLFEIPGGPSAPTQPNGLWQGLVLLTYLASVPQS